jgi:hypothetical protein
MSSAPAIGHAVHGDGDTRACRAYPEGTLKLGLFTPVYGYVAASEMLANVRALETSTKDSVRL